MDWQLIIAGLIVLTAAVYVIRSAWLMINAKSCASGCGTCATPEPKLIELQIRKSE